MQSLLTDSMFVQLNARRPSPKSYRERIPEFVSLRLDSLLFQCHKLYSEQLRVSDKRR